MLQKFDSDYDLKDDCIKHLDIFLTKGIVEANNRLEEYSDAVDQIKITSFGKYILEFLAADFSYLDLVCLDCGMYDEELSNFMIKAAEHEVELRQQKSFYERILSRVDRVDKFISYLEEEEIKEFQDLGLGNDEVKFSERMRQQFEIQRTLVVKSAKHNENR